MLDRDLDVDVAIVGAGVLGLTTAIALQRAGASVAVLEAREVAGGASGNNTAKLTSLQGLVYSTLSTKRPDALAEYASANEAGIEVAAELVSEYEIDCSFARATSYTYADDDSQLGDVEREAEAARAAGLDAELVDQTPLPFAVPGAVALAQQVELDPVAYLRGLADALDHDEPTVFERSRALQVDGTTARTEGGSVAAERVVIATHLPIVDRVGLFARAEPMASYAITTAIPGPVKEGMFIDAAGMHSLKRVQFGGEELLIVAGQGHRLGTGDPSASVHSLTEYARERFGARELRHHWDAHDFVTEDRLPFVGSVSPTSDGVLTATGFNKWGLALGSACATMLSAHIGGAENAWPSSFDSRRLPRPRSLGSLAKVGAGTARHFVGDRLKRGSSDVEPGAGRVVGAGLEQRAVYREEGGRRHQLSARCTHLGCIVAWNPEARTWDCPCHGSRFGIDGEVLEGPAIAPLERKP